MASASLRHLLSGVTRKEIAWLNATSVTKSLLRYMSTTSFVIRTVRLSATYVMSVYISNCSGRALSPQKGIICINVLSGF